MIAMLLGTLHHLEREAGRAVVVCHQVGYGVELSARSVAALGAIGDAVRLWVYTHVAEDQLRLFGFVAAAEREAFAVLLGIGGVGPKLALAMLSALSPGELAQAAAQQDKQALRRVAGVGAKKAERLLLELKDKCAAFAGQLPTPKPAISQRQRDVHSALLHLGFAPTEADEASASAVAQAPLGALVHELVRTALQHLTPPSAPLAEARASRHNA